MSRIGKKPINIPPGVEIKISEQGQSNNQERKVTIRGPKGELSINLPNCFGITQEAEILLIKSRNSRDKKENALWGTFTRLISNMVQGVSAGFEKKLEIVGVGYRAKTEGSKLILGLGFSHQVEFNIPENIKIEVNQNLIIVQGFDKQLVGEVAASIRRLKKPEPYKGKGIKYINEVIRRKAGKKVATAAG
jgi:large subunit ribosomal protein L6